MDIEQNKLKEYCGSQDQIWASFGGFKIINFLPNGTFKLLSAKLSKSRKKKLEENLLLMFTGYQRYSKNIEKQKVDKISSNFEHLLEIKKLTIKLRKILESNANLDKIADLLNLYWNLKKKLTKDVTNNFIERLYNKIIKNGALGAKLIGSGSGGFFLIYCNKKYQKKLKNKMKYFTFLNVNFSQKGSQIIYDKNNV